MTTTVKCKPILFSSPMVRAIIAGRKTQTRRIVKPQPIDGKVWYEPEYPGGARWVSSPLDNQRQTWTPHQVGDVLWVREKWRRDDVDASIYLAADYTEDQISEMFNEDTERWRPSIHMPYSVCRLWLEVTGVRVERVNAITHNDALAEGVEYDVSKEDGAPLARFRQLWESINGPDSWAANPWVWVYEFKRTEHA